MKLVLLASTMDDGPELVGTDDTSANLNLESIPPDIVIEIFSYLRADEIPSMRLVREI